MRSQPTRRRTQALTVTLAKRMLTILCAVLLVFSTPLQSLAQDGAQQEIVAAISDGTEDATESEDAAGSTEDTSADADSNEEAADTGETTDTEATEDTTAAGTESEEASSSDAEQQTDAVAAEEEDEASAVTLSDISLLATESNVSYLDANGVEQSVSSATVVEDSSAATTWLSGWLVVTSDTTISGRITVSGDIHLILANGATLTASRGITVGPYGSLTIYAQSTDESTMGKLIADGSGTTDTSGYGAGIGGYGGNLGTVAVGPVTINGGNITATGGAYSAGIGGGNGDDGMVITINGGIVTATGGRQGAGIGAGYYGCVESITINGGTIYAYGGTMGAGIGAAYGRMGSTTDGYVRSITIKNATVVAEGAANYAAGIGSSYDSWVGTITIESSNVTATGGWGAAGIGTGVRNRDTASLGSITISDSVVTAVAGEGSSASTAQAIGYGVSGSQVTDLTATFEINYTNNNAYMREATTDALAWQDNTSAYTSSTLYLQIAPFALEDSVSLSIEIDESVDLATYTKNNYTAYTFSDFIVSSTSSGYDTYVSLADTAVTGLTPTGSTPVTVTLQALADKGLVTITFNITVLSPTYTLTIYKYTGDDDGTDTPGTGLDGAVFSVVAVSGSDDTSDKGGTTASGGKLVVSGLEVGAVYKISETRVPSGYTYDTLTEDLYITVVNESGSLVGYVVEEESGSYITTSTTLTMTEDDSSFLIKVHNTQIESLPQTGGSGTLFIFAGGIALMALAAYALYRQRTGRGACAYASHVVAPYRAYQVRASRPYVSHAPTYQARASRPQPTRRRTH